MKYSWRDYNPETMEYVETWLDKHAIRMTGIDDGFRDNYEYWANYGENIVGENYWCKVVFENEIPFAVIQLGFHDGTFTIMETFVAPEKRNKGKGSEMIKELLANGISIIGRDLYSADAVIFPSNKASQRAFEKAGFTLFRIQDDGDALDYVFNK